MAKGGKTHHLGKEKMRTNFFCTNFFNSPRGPGHPGKIPGTSQVPPFQTQGRQTFKWGHELFDHHPFAWKTPTQRRKQRTRPPPKENLLGNFSGLKEKLSRSVVDTKTLKTRKPYLPPKSLLCGPHFFSAKKSSALEQCGVCFLFSQPPHRAVSGRKKLSFVLFFKARKTIH